MGTIISSIPEAERPYEKTMKYGPSALSDAELLAVIIRSGTNNTSAIDLASRILAEGTPEGLKGLIHYSLPELKEIPGIGDKKAVQLMCIAELSKRISRASIAGDPPVFDHPKKVADLYMEEMRDREQENLMLLILNTKNALIKECIISIGTVNASIITPRELYIEALRYRGVGIILLHNHPSGDPTPSREDCLLTIRISEAGKVIGIPLLDHIVIGDNCYVSLREQGIFET